MPFLNADRLTGGLNEMSMICFGQNKTDTAGAPFSSIDLHVYSSRLF